MTAQNDELAGPTAGARFDTGVREAVPLLVDEPVDDEIAEAAPRLGPDSLIWKFYGDHRTQFFGFQRVAGVENCIEQLAQGVLDHSVIFSDTLGRAKRTAPPLMKTVYSDDPHEWGRKVRDFHKPIKGTISDGSRYHALNPELFYWAHATFVDQVIYNTDMFIRRLTDAEKEQIFNEGKVWYSLYGVSGRGQPETYAEFVTYWDDMLERFVPHKTVLYGTGYIRNALDTHADLEDGVRAAERLHPSGAGRDHATTDARGVPARMGYEEGEAISAFRRRRADAEPGVQPLPALVPLHDVGGGGMAPGGR
jgi:hypothetical protein